MLLSGHGRVSQRIYTLYTCVNVWKLLAWNRHHILNLLFIYKLSGCQCHFRHCHLITLVKCTTQISTQNTAQSFKMGVRLNGGAFVWKLCGYGFESCCCHLVKQHTTLPCCCSQTSMNYIVLKQLVFCQKISHQLKWLKLLIATKVK